MATVSAQLKPYTILPYKRVEFPTYDGTILRGNLYTPPAPKTPHPS